MTINGKTLGGVKIGAGFRDALLAPSPMKENITNESRLEHGVRTTVIPKINSRTLTLQFQVTGGTKAAFESNLEALYAEFYSGTFRLAVPEITGEIFNLIYRGASPAYSGGLSGKACKVSATFLEPNPSNRV